MQKTCRKLPTSAFLVFFLLQFLGNPLDFQETAVGKTLKMLKLPTSAIFGTFLHLTGPLVAKLFHILVEEVISFEMSGLTSKSDKY